MWGKLQADAFQLMCQRLNEERIQWMVMRNYEGLPHENRSKDLDIGVAHKDFKRAHKLINQIMKEVGFSKIFCLKYEYAVCSTYFFDDGKCLESIKVDLIDGFVWRGAQLVDFADIYKRRVKYSDFFIPSQIDDGVMLLIKPLLTGGFIKKKYISDIEAALDNDMEMFKNIYQRIFGDEMFRRTWTYVETKCFEKLIPLKKELCIAAWNNEFKKHPFSTIVKFFDHIFLEIRRCIIRKKPTLFSVLGPDGVGKSTFLEIFKERLSELCVSDSESLYVFHFRPNILPNLKKLFGGKSYEESKEDFSNPHRGEKTNVFSSLIRMTYYWIDYVIGYYLKIKFKCRHNGKVLFDRYISDFLVDPERARIYLPYSLRELFVYLTPRVDIAYILSCDANIIYGRKKELSQDEIHTILERYEKVAKKDSRFVILDASKAPERIAEEACRVFVQRLENI